MVSTINRRVARSIGVFLADGLAGVTVGFYEYFAYRANWWKYEPARVMLGDFCAVYIPVGEFFMFLPVLLIEGGDVLFPVRKGIGRTLGAHRPRRQTR